MRIAVLAVVASVALSVPSAAQLSSPTAIARAYFDAIAIQEWRAAATLLRGEDLERIRRESIASFQPREVRTLTADDFLRHDPAMPRAFAQYQADQANKRIKELPDLGGLQFEFADVKDTAQLAALPLVDLGARWVEARDQRYAMRLMLSQSPNCPKGTYSAAIASMIPRYDILGEAVRADTAWVLYRKLEGPADMPLHFTPLPSVAMLVRAPAGWRIVPREDHGSAGSGALVGISCDRGAPD